MNFFKALISWKLWLSFILGGALLVGLWFYAFDFLKNYTNHGVSVEVPDLSELNVYEAMEKLDELKLRYEVDSVKFTEDYPPFAILDYYPLQGEKVKPGRRIFIKSNPSTWRPVALPDLIDKSSRLAITQLNLRGFVLGDTIYVKDPARDAVLGVLHDGDTVQAGKLLAKGAKIDLILGRGFRMDMPVPDIKGLSLDEAKEVLKEKYFDLGQIYYLGGTKTPEGASVVYQDPPAREGYDEGLPISIWLSTKDRSELRKPIDSLDKIYIRKLDEKDSLFYNSIESSRSIDIRDLPEEIRNQVKYDQNANEQMRPKEEKEAPTTTQPKKIDTVGISIE